MSTVDQAHDLFDGAPCGLLSTTPSGLVTTVNKTFLDMVECDHSEVVGRYLIRRFSRGSALYYETRFMPQLTQQGWVNEVAFDVQLANDRTLPVFVNAVVDTEATGGLDQVCRLRRDTAALLRTRVAGGQPGCCAV